MLFVLGGTERRREEQRAEKRAERDRKLDERRRELESWRDQRSPTEDMELVDHQPVVHVPRIRNLKLSGKVRPVAPECHQSNLQ